MSCSTEIPYPPSTISDGECVECDLGGVLDVMCDLGGVLDVVWGGVLDVMCDLRSV